MKTEKREGIRHRHFVKIIRLRTQILIPIVLCDSNSSNISECMIIHIVM